MSNPLRAVVAEDTPLLRRGIEQVLVDAGLDVSAVFDDSVTMLDALLHGGVAADVAVVDIKMPPTFTDEGLVALETLRAAKHPAGVVLLSMYVDPSYAIRALAGGDSGVGYLLKDGVADVDGFVDAVRRVATGGSAIDPTVVRTLTRRPATDERLQRLTPRERDVLALVAEGRSNRSIATLLHVTDKTTETHLAHIFQKLDLPPAIDLNRRVLATLVWLDGGAQRAQ